MKFLDVFSGIGGFRMGLEQAGHTCIGHIEFNEYARQAYEAIYDIKDDEFDGKDVTEIDDFTALRGGTTFWSEDSLVRALASQDIDEDSTIQEVPCFSSLLGSWNKQNHRFVCLRTSRAYYHTTKDAHLKPSSKRWMSSGMTSSGNCLTVKTSASLKKGNGCSLSDILEDDVPEKYFLTPDQEAKLIPVLNQE